MTSFRRPAGFPGASPSASQVLRGAPRVHPARRRYVRPLLVASGVLAAALGASQLLLPAFAEHQARAALGSQASGVSVHIEAMPAVKLLWHRADRVTVNVDRLTPRSSGSGSLGHIVSGLRVADRLDVRVGTLEAHGMKLHGVALHKDGDALTGTADVDLQQLQGALPFGLHVRPVPGPDDEIRIEGTTAALGTRIAARASLRADGGKIVVAPEGLPFASMLSIPVFSDDRIAIDRLGARSSGDGLVVTAHAHLRGA